MNKKEREPSDMQTDSLVQELTLRFIKGDIGLDEYKKRTKTLPKDFLSERKSR